MQGPRRSSRNSGLYVSIAALAARAPPLLLLNAEAAATSPARHAQSTRCERLGPTTCWGYGSPQVVRRCLASVLLLLNFVFCALTAHPHPLMYAPSRIAMAVRSSHPGYSPSTRMAAW